MILNPLYLSDLSGYQRVRLRAHRRRHRVKHTDHTEVDQLYVMLHDDEQKVNARRSKVGFLFCDLVTLPFRV